MEQAPRSASILCKTSVKVIKIDRKSFQDLNKSYSSLNKELKSKVQKIHEENKVFDQEPGLDSGLVDDSHFEDMPVQVDHQVTQVQYEDENWVLEEIEPNLETNEDLLSDQPLAPEDTFIDAVSDVFDQDYSLEERDPIFEDELYQKAMSFKSVSDHIQAIDCFKSLLIEYSSNEEIILELSDSYLQIEKYESAEKIYKYGVLKHKTSPRIWESFAQFYIHLGQTDRAKMIYQKAIDLNPGQQVFTQQMKLLEEISMS